MERVRNAVIICVGTALTACVDGSDGLAPKVSEADSAALATAAACPTFATMWQTSETAFAAAIAPATRVDLSRRADGSLPTAALTVPRDEYLSCCGVRLDYVGEPGGRLIWAGNPQSGFTIHAKCRGPDFCLESTGIRITFEVATTAAGAIFLGSTTAAVFDPQNTQISTMRGSGGSFLGYQSAALIDHAEFRDFLGESLRKMVYRRCL